MYPQSQRHMLIFRVPENMADEVGKLVASGQQKIPLIQSATSSADPNASKVFIEVQPDVEKNYRNPSAPDRFIVNFQGKIYPAMLMNIPTPVEAQKMFERHNVLKSGDIGQVLQLFNTEEELLQAQTHVKVYNPTPNMSDQEKNMCAVMSSGLTTATTNITKKRYELTRRETQTPTFHAVATLNEEIANTIRNGKVDLSYFVSAEGGSSDAPVLTTTEEEILDFADWMADDENPDGVKIVIRRKMESTSSGGATTVDTSLDSINYSLAQKYPDLVLGEVSKSAATST